MAESLVSHVVSQLTNLLMQEAASLGGVRHQIEWVKTQLHLLQGFLKDADSRRKRGDARMESWITGMRGVAYEMEDIIDTIMYMAERRRRRRGCMGSISRYSHKPCELITLHKIRSRIEQIKIEIQTICQSTVSYALANPGQTSAVDESSQSLRESSPHSDDDDSDVIGFEDDKKELMSQLLDGNEKTRCVISIAGMGGLGKSMSCSSAGGFPRLQHLILAHLDNLEEWRVEDGALPGLTHLTILHCYELKMLPEGLQHVSTLRELKLIQMPSMFNDRVRNEDGYKVHHIPSIVFEEEL